MFRAAAVLCLLPFLSTIATAQPPRKLLPRDMEVGQVGELWPAGRSAPLAPGVVKYMVTEVGKDWLALRVDTQETEGDGMTILVKGVDTKGLVEDRPWKPSGIWKVESTEIYKGKKRFALRPQEQKK